MLSASLGPIVRDMRAAQRAIGAACAQQPEGWRQQVVQRRRDIAGHLGHLTALLAAAAPAPPPGIAAFRRALSALRSALAEHQASWPAVTLDPLAEPYQQSVGRVRAGFDALERALAALDHPLSDGVAGS